MKQAYSCPNQRNQSLCGQQIRGQIFKFKLRKCWVATRDQGAMIEKKQGGKTLWKWCSKKPPLKVETCGWRMRRRSWVKHAGNSIQARGTAYELVNCTGDGRAQEAERSLCSWKATKQRDAGRLQEQTDSVTHHLALGWDWNFTVGEQAITDMSQTGRHDLICAFRSPLWLIRSMIDLSGTGHQQGAQAGGSKPVEGLAAWPGELGQWWKLGGGSEKKQQNDRTCPLTGDGDDGERDESGLVFYSNFTNPYVFCGQNLEATSLPISMRMSMCVFYMH